MSNETLSQSRADLLVQSVTDCAIYMLDPDGIVSSWNPGAERLKQFTADEIIGQHFSRFYTREDSRSGLPARVLRAALEQCGFEAEGWRVRKDGTRFWANVIVDPVRDEQGRHIGFAKVTRDLTERKMAEEALRRSEERFRLLVQNVTDYAIYMLDPDGYVSSWNAGAQRFKGYTADEIIGRHFSAFYLPEDRAAQMPQMALQTAKHEGRFEAQGWRVRKDGSRFWANVVIDPIREDGGALVGFTKITRDLTERKMAQEALDAAQKQIFQSQKMEAIGKLTGGVAHDFNNILAAILGSLQIASKRMAEGQDVGRFLDNAVAAAERGATLTQRMLAFARKQELQLEPVGIVRCVREMAELLERTIGPGITISTRFPASLPAVIGDRTQLELALMNLVVNARDAMPGGGQITIAAELCQRPGDGPTGFVCLSVADEGQGMDEATLSNATEPFFTTKGIGKGTGLGLPMVKGMIEQCGGEFCLTSELGKGTTAEIRLPVASDGQERSCEPPKPFVQGGRQLCILAVDDDAIVLLNTVTMLSDMGHEVLQATSGPAALEILKHRPVDMLITDYAMPGMSGGDLVREAGNLRPELRCVILSGYADAPEGTAPGIPRLAKPFADHDLASIVAMSCG
ncbi:hybrid sensor histidine kinase/response regulator [Altericroceibacterium xinjiangense]|uniref:hybrid sensor histidine kinase/response regulator n=1 Tax=Altericroceibacterium xinjiangense TaxID=762261 RepID=UPI000F7E5F3B|nr:PAS domain-containing sensor histidine kinase [Altericroceibacterium xinjiangense]